MESMHLYEEVIEHYPDVQTRYVFYPKKSLPSSFISVLFSHDDIVSMMAQGEKEGIQTILDGPVGNDGLKRIASIMKKRVA